MPRKLCAIGFPLMFESNADSGNNEKGDHADSGGQTEGSKNTKDDTNDKGERLFTQAELDKYLADRFKRERGAIRKEVEDEIRRDAEAAAAKEQGDFKTLYEQAQQELDALKSEKAERERTDLRRKIASDAGLDPDMHERLVGETEAELKADAKKLAALVKKDADGPETDAGKTRTEKVVVDDEQTKKMRDKTYWGLPS